jgi:endonuclease/exonuclease/phosphatase family metal-dependent hydrolase
MPQFAWSVLGDFNAIRSSEERVSRSRQLVSEDYEPFNHFISNNELVDLPLCGRQYTWYRGDGLSMSRLDRFLLSESWCHAYPNCIQAALPRTLSDHCPIQLTIDDQNWGPKPLRMLKCWADFPGYKEFVREKWLSSQVFGWSGFILKSN